MMVSLTDNSLQETTTQAFQRVAVYARVSTEEQAEEGFSIEGQIDTVRKYASTRGHFVVEEYIDRGVSGKSIEGRYALQRLLEEAKEKKFDVVYVWKISRLARKNVDLLSIVEQLSKSNVKVFSISENFDTETTMGKFSLQMMGAVAEFERNTIVENVKLGMRQRARKGQWNGGTVLGYRSTSTSSESNVAPEVSLEIVPEEAVIVRKIFELFANGKGLKAIANQINKEGYRTKRNNTFSTAAVKEILLNPVYAGKIRFNRYENWSEKRRKGKSDDVVIVDGNHEAIIDESLWQKVQLIQQQKSKTSIKNYEGNYLLVGLMKCPKCGASMVSTRTTNTLKDGTEKVLRYYSCSAFRSKGSAVCNSNSVRADYAEDYVLNQIKTVMSNSKVMQQIIQRTNQLIFKKKGPLEEELKVLKTRIDETEVTRNKYLQLYENNLIEQDMIIDRLNEIREERDNLLKRKSEIEFELKQGDTEPLDAGYVQKLLKAWHQIVQAASFEQQKVLLQLIIEDIEVNVSKKIDRIKLNISEEIQKEVLQETLSDDESDRVFSICLII